MVDFKALAERAITVQVAGEDVHLRPPNLNMQLAVKRFLAASAPLPEGATAEEKSEAQDKQVHAYLRLTAEALHATVVTEDEITIDQWERIISIQDSEAPEGLRDLVDGALRLCGMDVKLPEGAEDHVADADDAVGNSATK